MKQEFAKISLAMVFGLSIAALAQTGNAAGDPAAAPAAPSAAMNAPAPAPTGTKVATINIEQAIFATNEGQREFETLSKKLEPKQNELKNLNDEIDSLKKQLSAQGDKLNDDSRANLVKQIEQKQKLLDRQVQDAREDAQNQQNEIAQKILQKLAPVIMKYSADNGLGLVIDTSNPWPQGPVLIAGPSFDITKPIVDAYNAQSGVAAPAKPAAAKPAGAGIAKPTGAKPQTVPAQPPK
jgi:outer membrane protein